MRRAPPFPGRVSIGLVRSNTCLVGCASPKITFTTAQARENAAAGIRRAVAAATGLMAYTQKFFHSCVQWLCDRGQRETIGAPRNRHRAVSGLLSCAIESSTSWKAERLVRSRRVRLPQCNGVIERFMRTLKEQCLWLHRFHTLDEARIVIAAFIERYNHQWLIERLGHRTPATARREMLAVAA